MKHHLFIGTWTPPGAIFTVAFDDQAHTLELVKRTSIPENEPTSWLTISHDKKTLYGASMKYWSSHSVKSPTELSHLQSKELSHSNEARDTSSNTRAIFCLASQTPPYALYGAPFYKHADHLNIFSVSPDTGSLESTIQNLPLCTDAGVHGAVFSPHDNEAFLYSADMHANCIWTHSRDQSTGELTFVDRLQAPAEKDQPRWIAAHPAGSYLYVVMEHGNRLAEYVVDPKSGRPVFTHHTFPLSPPSIQVPPHPHFRGDNCAVSSSGKYLFASTRCSQMKIPGYISVFKLKNSGAIDKQMAIVPTCSSGGHSNAVSPCPWSDEWLAVTDDDWGGVEMYRWDGEWLGRVARLEVKEKGFGMNAVWYD